MRSRLPLVGRGQPPSCCLRKPAFRADLRKQREQSPDILPRSPPGDFMAYTFTERKRIRKSFGTRESVLKIPYLLQMQKDAYTAFLQADTPPKKRKIGRAHV